VGIAISSAVTSLAAATLSVVATPIEVGTVALGAQRIPALSLTMHASCEAPVTISEVRLTHTGRGSPADIDGVFLATDIRRVSRVTRFDSRGDAYVRFPRFTIPACGSVEATVLFNLSRTASVAGEHGVEITSALDIQSNAAATDIQIFDETTATLVASPQTEGALTVSFLPVHGRPRYGRESVVARVQISADGEGDHLLREITFTNEENARNYNLLDIRLTDARGTVLTRNLTRMDERIVHLYFEPTYVLERSQSKIFLLKGIPNASLSKKFRFILEEETDLYATPYRARR